MLLGLRNWSSCLLVPTKLMKYRELGTMLFSTTSLPLGSLAPCQSFLRSFGGRMVKKEAKVGIQDFVLLKAFKINIKPHIPNIVMEVFWTPPLINWVKGNTDGASIEAPSRAVWGVVFRDHLANHVDTFACFLDRRNTFLVSSWEPF